MTSNGQLWTISLFGFGFNVYIREGLDHPKRPVLAYNTISLTKTSTYIRGV